MRIVPSDLVWFEVEVSPHHFRFAAIPGQPILMGRVVAPGQEVSTWLMPREPQFQKTITMIQSRLCELIEKHRIPNTPPHQPGDTFTPDFQKKAYLHIRIAVKERRWQSCFPIDALPKNIAGFLANLEQLTISLTKTSDRRMTIEEVKKVGRLRKPP